MRSIFRVWDRGEKDVNRVSRELGGRHFPEFVDMFELADYLVDRGYGVRVAGERGGPQEVRLHPILNTFREPPEPRV